MREIEMKFFIIMLFVIGCGQDEVVVVEVPAPTVQPQPVPPSPQPRPKPSDPSEPPTSEPAPSDPTPPDDFAKISSILSTSCLGSRCHSTPGKDGVNLDSEEGFDKAFSRVIKEVKKGNMPIGRTRLSDKQIETLENYRDDD